MINEEIQKIMNEKKDDRCTRIAKRKYDVWPSAYASGAVVKCRQGKIWKDIKEEELSDGEKKELEDILKDEGGAAGMEPFEKKIDEPAKDIKKALDDNPDVGQHEDGDYILDDGDEIKVVKEEELSDAEMKELEGIRGELEGASKMHKKQADKIGDVLSEDELEEAVYQGRKVPLNKPMRGDVKKFKVYVNSGKKDKEGRVVAKKVNFGDPNMKIKKSNPKRRKSFRARHNCDNPGPKTKARYWSCKKW